MMKLTIVVDASLALKWVIQEEGTNEALTLWNRWQEADEFIIAPPIFRGEVTSALHQNVRQGRLNRQDAVDGLDVLLQSVATIEPPDLYRRTMIIAGELSIGSAYDVLYLVLADLQGSEMWTSDQRLVRTARSRFPRIRSLWEISDNT